MTLLLLCPSTSPLVPVIDRPSFCTLRSMTKGLDELDPDGGLSINPFTGEVPTSGTMVAIDGEELEDLSQDAVAAFISPK